MVNAEKFRIVLNRLLDDAQTDGRPFLALTAGELHRTVGRYPGPRHQIPNCCSVMKSEMGDGDAIIAASPSGVGASLKIRYRLPRADGNSKEFSVGTGEHLPQEGRGMALRTPVPEGPQIH